MTWPPEILHTVGFGGNLLYNVWRFSFLHSAVLELLVKGVKARAAPRGGLRGNNSLHSTQWSFLQIVY